MASILTTGGHAHDRRVLTGVYDVEDARLQLGAYIVRGPAEQGPVVQV